MPFQAIYPDGVTMPSPEIVGPIIGAAITGILALVGGVLRSRQQAANYATRERLELERLKLLSSLPATTPADVREEIESHRVSQPPIVGPALVLIAAFAGATGYVSGQTFTHPSVLEVVSTKAKCTAANCKGKCVGGRCQIAAEPPERPAPKPGPTTSADSLVVRLSHSDDPARLDPI